MNYELISKSIKHYTERGYVYVPHAPWLVGEEAINLTRPEGASSILAHFGSGVGAHYLVASGEQSFIQMMIDGQPLKRAICCTPCFRPDRYDALHRPYFMKTELINAHDVDGGHLIQMISDALAFFEPFVPVRVVELGEGRYDIVEKGTRIELGSYGIRTETLRDGRRFSWVFGTGCAEPRLSDSISQSNGKVGR